LALSPENVAQIVAEFAEPLAGARLQKITQPGEDRILLRFRSARGPFDLLIVAGRDLPRVHLVRRIPPSPPEPPPFCRALRKHIEGARVEEVTAVPGERIVEIRLHRGPRPRGTTHRLVAELFGRGANVALVDDAGIVVAVLHARARAARSLGAGAPYARPAPPPAPRPPDPEPLPRDSESPFPHNAGLERACHESEVSRALERERETIQREIRRRRRRLDSRHARVEADRARLDDPATLRRKGEGLKGALTTLGGAGRRGLATIEVPDPLDPAGGVSTIALDPRLSVGENMERFFHRARRSARAAERIAAHLAWIGEEVRRLDDLETATREAASLEALRTARASLVDDTTPGSETRRDEPRRGRRDRSPAAPAGPRRFHSKDGLLLLVGRNARENDTLTFRIARGEDLWLHTRDYPGSHVIVRVERGRPVPEETLLDAGHLAAHFSPARGHGRVAILYAPRKLLRKAKGAPSGQVLVAKPRSLDLRVDPARLARLLGAHPPFAPTGPGPGG